MKRFRTTNEYNVMPVAIKEYLETVLPGTGQFEYLLGGDVLVVENAEDLAQIPVGNGSATNTIHPMDNVEDIGEYVLFFNAENNLGGNGYFVPKAIYDQSIILKLIHDQTREYWS